MLLDTIIVGAGAAGFFAAIAAGERKKQTLLLEKGNKTGAKILMSGGTRCNLTQNTDQQGIVEAFGKPGKFLLPALSLFSPADVRAWFGKQGVATKIEKTGKVFPCSDRAIDVRNALLNRVEELACVDLKTNSPVQSVRKVNGEFCIDTSHEILRSRTVVITSGGKSYPGSGTTGDGYGWLEKLGHSIIEPIPALTPIVCPAQWVKNLKGVTVPDVKIGVVDVDQVHRISEKNFRKISLDSCQGSLLFTHFGLSGPAALNVSKQVALRPDADLKLVIDFLPHRSFAEIRSWFECNDNQRKLPKTVLQGLLPVRVSQQLLVQAGIKEGQNLAETRRTDLNRLLNFLKFCEIEVEGTRGFKKAEVTSGGVNLKEVNSQTMESRLCEGLFLAGEILDLDGPIGGYNFQSAFSTGYLAGRNI